MDKEIRQFADKIGLDYLRNDDTINKPFIAPPTLVNFFYHEEIKKSAQQ